MLFKHDGNHREDCVTCSKSCQVVDEWFSIGGSPQEKHVAFDIHLYSFARDAMQFKTKSVLVR